MFFEMLFLAAGGAGLMTALLEGKKAGVPGILISIPVGFGIGAIFFWGTRAGTYGVMRWLRPHEPRLPGFLVFILSWLILASAFGGVVASSYFGIHVTRRVLAVCLPGRSV